MAQCAVGVRRAVLRRVRRSGRRVPTLVPGLGRGRRGLPSPQEATQKEHG